MRGDGYSREISFVRSERCAMMSKAKRACTTQHDNKLVWTSMSEGPKQSAQVLNDDVTNSPPPASER